MAIQKISNTVIDTGAVTSDSLATGAVNAADISAGTITVDKLHTTLNLSSHTVTLPTLNSSVNIDVGDLIVKDTTGGAQGQVQIGAGTVQGFINIQKGDGTRTVQISSNADSYFNGGNVGIGTTSPSYKLHSETSSGTDYAGYFRNTAGSGNGTSLITRGGANNTSANFQVQDYNGNADFTVTGVGNVGIGTTNPTVKLTTAIAHSNGAVAEGLKLTTDGSYSSSNSEEAGPAISFGQFHTLYPTWKTGQISGIRDGSSWNGSLSFWTNSGSSETDISEKMRITGAGDAGIGTNNPVSMGGNFNTFNLNGIKGGGLSFSRGTNSATQQYNIYTTDDDGLHFYRGGFSNQVMSMTSAGNVGIGTTNPVGKLHVGFSGRAGILIGSTNGAGSYLILDGAVNGDGSGSDYAYIEHQSSGNLAFNVGNSSNSVAERMTISPGGNVGIGDNNPDAKLHVSGNVKVGSAASSSWATSNHDLGGLDVFVGSGSHALQLWDDNYHTRPRFEVQRDGHVYAGQNMQFHEDNTSTTTPFAITGSSSSNNFFVPNTYGSGNVNETYRHCYTINAAHHWVLFRGGGGNTVFNTYAFISGEHYQDISVWSVTMYYSDLKIKIIQNTGTDKSIWVAGNTFNNNVYGLNWRIMPVEPCTIQHNPSGSQSTGYMIHHATGGEQFTGTAAFTSGTGPTTY
ncbi:MAG: hypothetical protein CBB72_011345 [Muricauda sp. TMED12]|nr:MAG: hypothetical protein CBB72_011345 [Muricauda sp. TMED12]